MLRPGQRIVCLDDSNWIGTSVLPIKKGECYVARAVSSCPKCGTQLVDIGLKARAKTSTCACRRITFQDVGDTRWFRACRFAPVIDNFADEVLSVATKQIEEQKILTKAMKS